jgi:hypothetical protein
MLRLPEIPGVVDLYQQARQQFLTPNPFHQPIVSAMILGSEKETVAGRAIGCPCWKAGLERR